MGCPKLSTDGKQPPNNPLGWGAVLADTSVGNFGRQPVGNLGKQSKKATLNKPVGNLKSNPVGNLQALATKAQNNNQKIH